MLPPFKTAANFNHAHIAHGFFGRQGGVSSGTYESLNCGPGSDDDPKAVIVNRQRCVDALGGDQLVTAYQIHSDKAVFTRTVFDSLPEADAIVTYKPGLVIGVLTADCMPVLLADAEAGVIGAAHAGWRGALGGILESCIHLMCEHGAKPSNIFAAIGPCLQLRNFEVGLDLLTSFTEKYPEAERFFHPGVSGEKRQLDLTEFGIWRLTQTGLLRKNISSLGECTLGDPNAYFSYRHSRRIGANDYGRNLSAITLRDA